MFSESVRVRYVFDQDQAFRDDTFSVLCFVNDMSFNIRLKIYAEKKVKGVEKKIKIKIAPQRLKFEVKNRLENRHRTL